MTAAEVRRRKRKKTMIDINVVTPEGTRYRIGSDADGFGCYLFRGRKRLMSFAENKHTGSMVIQQLYETIKASGETSPIPTDLVNRALRRKAIAMTEIEKAFAPFAVIENPETSELKDVPQDPALR